MNYAETNVSVALREIGELPGRIAHAVGLLSDDFMRERPDPDMWSPIEYLCHMRDVLAAATIRLYRVRTEESPAVEPMFNDLRAARFRYCNRDRESVISEISDNAAGFCDEANQLPTDGWDRSLTRLPGESRTARWLVRQTLHELIHHLGDITGLVTDEARPPG